MSPKSLYHTITAQLNKEYAHDPRYAQMLAAPLMTLARHMHFFSFDLRKFIVTCMRVQQPIMENYYLSGELFKLQMVETHVFGYNHERIPLSTIVDLIDRVREFPPSCSVLSFLARAETTMHVTQAEEIKETTIQKEVTAALTFLPSSQKLDYSALFHDQVIRAIHPGSGVLSAKTRFYWRRGIRQLKQRFARGDTPPLLPYINGRKNLGYQTQIAFKVKTGTESETMDITSADILIWYMHTGDCVYGPLEIRIAWRFNDLKPRVYYALGGDAYWFGLHIKEVANLVCAILPSTNPFSRFNIQRLDVVGPDQLLVTYDYTSFTTSLTELKSFLFWLGQELRGILVDILDVHVGIRKVDLGDLITSYNELVNIHQDVDLSRLTELSFDTVFQQGRNGSLGVQGNIVFSTTLHGISLGGITDNPEGDSCVGDDALFLIMSSLVQTMMHCVNNLGDVALDKFSMLHRPPFEDPNLMIREAFKYLKRPLAVDFTGRILEGTLDFFPSLADALFPEGDGIHSAHPGRSVIERVMTFVTQWGRFLRLNPMTPTDIDLYEDEVFVILALVQSIYDKYGLAYSGQLPGGLIFGEGGKLEQLDAWVPPCNYSSVFTQSWMNILYGEFHGSLVTVPLRVGGVILPPVACIAEEVFEATSNKALNLLQHLECVQREIVTIQVRFDEGLLAEQERLMKGETDDEMVYRYRVKFVPHWYTDLMSYYHPVLTHPDGEESVRDIESMFGHSTIYSS